MSNRSSDVDRHWRTYQVASRTRKTLLIAFVTFLLVGTATTVWLLIGRPLQASTEPLGLYFLGVAAGILGWLLADRVLGWFATKYILPNGEQHDNRGQMADDRMMIYAAAVVLLIGVARYFESVIA